MARPLVHALLLLLHDIHVGSADAVIAKLRAQGFDLATTGAATWDGRPVVVVGAVTGDTTARQFGSIRNCRSGRRGAASGGTLDPADLAEQLGERLAAAEALIEPSRGQQLLRFILGCGGVVGVLAGFGAAEAIFLVKHRVAKHGDVLSAWSVAAPRLGVTRSGLWSWAVHPLQLRVSWYYRLRATPVPRPAAPRVSGRPATRRSRHGNKLADRTGSGGGGVEVPVAIDYPTPEWGTAVPDAAPGGQGVGLVAIRWAHEMVSFAMP